MRKASVSKLMETMGKVYVVEGVFRRCLVCDCLFTVEASKQHAIVTCFPQPESGGFTRQLVVT